MMRTDSWVRCVAAAALAVCGWATSLAAQDEQPVDAAQPVDTAVADAEAAIAAQVKAYESAFNAGDLEGLIALWTANGVYINRSTSEIVQGRPALLDQMKAIHGNESKPQIELTSESIELISPSVALERGTAIVTYGENDATQSRYQVVFVKTDDLWLIDRVTEEDVVTPITNYERLQPLEWMIGDWVDDDGETRIEIACAWARNQNFISRRYSVYVDGEVTSSGLEIIGWDPLAEHIRSWVFDSEGTYVESVWSAREDEWVVQSIATFIDGARGSSTSIYKQQEDGNFTFRKTNQVVDGAIMPSTDEVLIVRQQ